MSSVNGVGKMKKGIVASHLTSTLFNSYPPPGINAVGTSTTLSEAPKPHTMSTCAHVIPT